MSDIDYGGESDHWRTEPALFKALHLEFGFVLDAAATKENALVDQYLGAGGVAPDALAVDWYDYAYYDHGDGNVHTPGATFCNHPYSCTDRWLKHIVAIVEARAQVKLPGESIVTLTPVMPSESWWSKYVMRAVEVRLIPHRLRYLRADGQKATTARFSSAVIIFRPQPGLRGAHSPRFVTWSYRP